jgi:hypothetical protein
VLESKWNPCLGQSRPGKANKRRTVASFGHLSSTPDMGISRTNTDLPLHLRLIRAALRRLNISLSRRRERRNWQPHSERDSLGSLEIALRKLRLDDPTSQAYFDKPAPPPEDSISGSPATWRRTGAGVGLLPAVDARAEAL